MTIRVLFLISLVLIAAQCNTLGVFVEPTPLPPVELTYITFDTDDASGDAEAQLITQFEAANPNITIARSEYNQSIEAYLKAEASPDIMLAIADYATLSAIEAGLALDINEVGADAYLAGTAPSQFGLRQGRRYFLPIGQSWNGIYYNRQVFERENIPIPATWDELLAASETLWLSGVTPFALPANHPWALSLWFDYLVLRMHGLEFYTELTRGEIEYTDIRVQEVLETWRDLLDKGYFGDNYFTPGLMRLFDRVAKGEAAMILAGPLLMNELPEVARSELDFFAFPPMTSNAPNTELVPLFGYIIPAQTQHPQEATAFLRHMTSPQVQTAFFQQLDNEIGVVPVHSQIDPLDLDPASGRGLTLIRQAEATAQPLIFSQPEPVSQALILGLRQFLRDTNTIGDVLDGVESRRQQVFQ